MNSILENLMALIESTHDVKDLKLGLSRFGKSEEILNTLMLILRNKDNSHNTRAKALRLIYEIDNNFSKEILLSYTQDKSSSLRLNACGILSYYLPEEKISKHLENVLLSDTDVDVRLMAVFAIEKTGMLSAIKTLEWAKNNDLERNWETRSVSDYADDAINAIKSRSDN